MPIICLFELRGVWPVAVTTLDLACSFSPLTKALVLFSLLKICDSDVFHFSIFLTNFNVWSRQLFYADQPSVTILASKTKLSLCHTYWILWLMETVQ